MKPQNKQELIAVLEREIQAVFRYYRKPIVKASEYEVIEEKAE